MSVKPQSHLINILKTTRDHHPNFVLFLGAGASATSGIKLGSEMITEWRKATYDAYCPDKRKSIEDYLDSQHWYGSNDEYSILFEKLYDQPSQRREYIESCIKLAKPSWGYIYLVNLFLNRIFNTTFTTNFDDLLNEACYMFSSGVRPMVCAHDSSIRSIRITSQRPKIIKIHGDFLYDNIKNTLNELESLEQNTSEKFKQYAAEFGFIFIGYSGKDRSIMDTLNNLLKFDHFFPHGIYWCVRDPEKVSDAVKNLCRFNKVHLIQIDGFDEIFADMHEALQLKLQPEMSDPYSALAGRTSGKSNVLCHCLASRRDRKPKSASSL
jgi:NAD-dependent SIR2 family protein deacetylase